MSRWWEVCWVAIAAVVGGVIGAAVGLLTYRWSSAPLDLGRGGSVEAGAMLGAFVGCLLGVLAVRWRKVFRGEDRVPY